VDNQTAIIELEVTGLSYTKKNNFWNKLFGSESPQYYLILSKKDELNKQVPLLIGEFEGQSIAIVLEKMTPLRPLTHDIFKTAVDKFDFKLDYVLITKVDNDGIFHSTIFYSGNNKKIELDSRAADAIALALRHASPIYINKTTFNLCSVLTPE
jgi:bifunctional DNase/RNase